jgi:Zn-dependent protease
MFSLNPVQILLTIPGIVLGFAFHEFAHAIAADRLGDPTPRNQGRLTLDPRAHMDLIGLILIIVAGFGWAKPVEINSRYFRKPRRDDLIVSFAGPFMNLLIGIFFVLLLKVFFISGMQASLPKNILVNIYRLIDYTISINVWLFLFNLLPVPPLDGFHILADILPARNYRVIYFLQQYSTIILILLILTRAVSYILGPLYALIYNGIFTIVGL